MAILVGVAVVLGGSFAVARITGLTPAPTTSTSAPVTTTTSPSSSSTTVAVTSVPITTPMTTVPATTTTEAPPDRRGGEVTVGLAGEITTLNPLLEGGDGPVAQAVGAPVWSGAFGSDAPSQEPVADLAVQLPTTSNGGLRPTDDGGLRVTFDLDPDAVWEDGTPVTGDDFAATYALATDPDLPIRDDVRARYAEIVPGSLFALSGRVSYVLERPSLAYLSLFDVVVPAHAVEADGFETAWNDTMWLSAGPFSWDFWEVDTVALVRNDRYRGVDTETGQALPYLDELRFTLFTDAEGLAEAFRAGTVDVADLPADPDLIEDLQGTAGVEVQVGAGPDWEHLGFQFGEGRFEANPDSLVGLADFRRAIAFQLDRERIVDAVYGDLGRVLSSPAAMAWGRVDDRAWEQYRPFPERVAELLAAVETEQGRAFDQDPPTLVLTTTDSEERSVVAREVAAMLGDAGIEVEAQLDQPGFVFADRLIPGVFEAGEWAWESAPGPVGVVDNLTARLRSPEAEDGRNFYNWATPGSASDPEATVRFTELVTGLSTQVDLDELAVRIAEVEQILADQVVQIPLYPVINPGGVWSDRVQGYVHNVYPPGDTWNAETWYRVDG